MARRKIAVSRKGRRLVERAISLQVRKVTTRYYPTESGASLADTNKANAQLDSSARVAKQKLLEYLTELEQ